MSVYKNQKGQWCCKFRYTTWNGEVKQKKKENFPTKKAALDFENDFMNNIASTPDILFKHLCTHYLNDCTARLKASTLEIKRNICNKMLLPYFGNMPINQIDVNTVRRWQNELITHDNDYSETYLRTVHCQLSAIMNFACKYYKLPSNPARECGSMGTKKADAMEIWTTDEFNTFVESVSDKPMSKVIFNILFYSGMREGELLALTYNDFDFDKNTISVTKTYSRIKGQDIVTEPKTKKSRRIITMPAEVMDMVKEYRSKLYDYNESERFFGVTKSYVLNEIERGCKRSGVKKIRCHDLRHSHASLLIELGFSPLLISERLGHENIETTLNTYSHLYPNKHNEVADQLSKLISG